MYKRSVCPHDCPDTCGLLVGVEGGRVVSVRGETRTIPLRGALCASRSNTMMNGSTRRYAFIIP